MGGGDLEGDGIAGKCAADRAWPRPRHHDARRAARGADRCRSFRKALVVHLVEVSPALEKRQRAALSGTDVPVEWHQSLEQVPDGPAIILANEFFDALPVHQAVMCVDGWHERVVKIADNGNLQFAHARDPIPLFEQMLPRAAAQRADRRDLRMARRSGRARTRPARRALGRRGAGDRLRPSQKRRRRHLPGGRRATPSPIRWTTPGNVDLTAHVDFQALAHAAAALGARTHGPIEQAQIPAPARHRDPRRGAQKGAPLRQERRDQQCAGAADRRGRHRHGRLFKAIGFSHQKIGELPGFESWQVDAEPRPPSAALHAEMSHAASRLAVVAPGIRHAFFTRAGGVSDGVYASLNGGIGSDDAPGNVAENRARMAAALGVQPEHFLTAYQIHSPDVVTVEKPWTRGHGPRADAIVTRRPGHRDRRRDRRLRAGPVRRRAARAWSAPPMPAGAARSPA